ncbi:MAG: nitroreductase family protein, partial [Pseudoxanthomonas sp.]
MSTQNPHNAFLEALNSRRSVPSKQLADPGPDTATLMRMLQAAVRVPDHGKLVPFRFLKIDGDDRHFLGDALAARTLQRDPDAAPAAVE